MKLRRLQLGLEECLEGNCVEKPSETPHLKLQSGSEEYFPLGQKKGWRQSKRCMLKSKAGTNACTSLTFAKR